MKYCRFIWNNRIHYGVVEERNGEPWITQPGLPPEEDLEFRASIEKVAPSGYDFEPVPMSKVELLAPVTPQKIICVGRNYREHARELGNEVPAEPLIFFKPPSSLLPPGGAVVLPKLSERVDYEGELVLVIGKKARRLAPDADWKEVIRGYTLANDVSARDLQKKDAQWTRAKGFDTFCPLGPVVSDEVDPVAGVKIETRVNGELRQQGSSRDFIFAIPQLLSYITAAMTLEPGDVILTGTPSGVGQLHPGDKVEISAVGIGKLTHTVQAEAE